MTPGTIKKNQRHELVKIFQGLVTLIEMQNELIRSGLLMLELDTQLEAAKPKGKKKK